MDRTQVVQVRQMTWLVASVLAGGGLLSIQHVLIRIARIDAWTSYLLPIFYVFGIAYVFYKLSQRFKDKNLFEINKLMFGKIAGTTINALLVGHMWLMLVRDIRLFSRFVGTVLLPNTPEEVLVLLFMLLLLFYGRTSLEVAARVNDIFFPVFMLLVVSLPLLLSNELDKHFIQPVLTVTAANFIKTNLLSIGWFGDAIVIGAFLHMLWSPRQLRSALRHGGILAGAILTTFVFMEVIVLGPKIPGNFIFPSYSLVQLIHITDFLDRIDLTMLSIWYPITLCKVIVIYLGFLTGITSLFGRRDYSLISSPVGLLLTLTAIASFRNAADTFSFGNFSSLVITLAYQPLYFVVLLLLVRKRPIVKNEAAGRAKDASAAGNQGNDSDGQDGGKRNGSRRKRVRYETWSLASSLLMAACLVLIIIGIAWSRYYSLIGIVCGIGYAVLLLLALITSRMEISSVRKQAESPENASAAAKLAPG